MTQFLSVASAKYSGLNNMTDIHVLDDMIIEKSVISFFIKVEKCVRCVRIFKGKHRRLYVRHIASMLDFNLHTPCLFLSNTMYGNGYYFVK